MKNQTPYVFHIENYNEACKVLGIKPKVFSKSSPFQGIYKIFEQLRIIVAAYNYINNCGNIFIPNYDGRYNVIAYATYILNDNKPTIKLSIKYTIHILCPIDLVFVNASVGYACLKEHKDLWYQWFSYSNRKNIYNQKLLK